MPVRRHRVKALIDRSDPRLFRAGPAGPPGLFQRQARTDSPPRGGPASARTPARYTFFGCEIPAHARRLALLPKQFYELCERHRPLLIGSMLHFTALEARPVVHEIR
jgi:hypothetical protein